MTAQSTDTRVTSIRFEIEPCGRCGGSGEYSFNLMHGTVCYGCGGSGKRLSRKGKAARAKFDAFLAEHYSVRVEDLEPGCQIRDLGKWHRLIAVNFEPLSWSLDHDTGEWVPTVGLKLPKGTLCVSPGSTVQVRPTSEQFNSEVVPFMRRYSGAIITEARAAA